MSGSVLVLPGSDWFPREEFDIFNMPAGIYGKQENDDLTRPQLGAL